MRSQRDCLREMFKSRPYQNIHLPEILSLNIAQYNTRIKELRAEGMKIVNDGIWVNGQHRTWFRYEPLKQEANGQMCMV